MFQIYHMCLLQVYPGLNQLPFGSNDLSRCSGCIPTSFLLPRWPRRVGSSPGAATLLGATVPWSTWLGVKIMIKDDHPFDTAQKGTTHASRLQFYTISEYVIYMIKLWWLNFNIFLIVRSRRSRWTAQRLRHCSRGFGLCSHQKRTWACGLGPWRFAWNHPMIHFSYLFLFFVPSLTYIFSFIYLLTDIWLYNCHQISYIYINIYIYIHLT